MKFELTAPEACRNKSGTFWIKGYLFRKTSLSGKIVADEEKFISRLYPRSTDPTTLYERYLKTLAPRDKNYVLGATALWLCNHDETLGLREERIASIFLPALLSPLPIHPHSLETVDGVGTARLAIEGGGRIPIVDLPTTKEERLTRPATFAMQARFAVPGKMAFIACRDIEQLVAQPMPQQIMTRAQ